MISPKGYRRLTNAAMICTAGILIVGAFGLSGCAIEGDTYSGVVTNVDCSSASSGGLMKGTAAP